MPAPRGLSDCLLSLPWAPGAPQAALRHWRRAPKIDRPIPAAFTSGLLIRKVAGTLRPILGEPVSPAAVGQVARQLAADLSACHRRCLAGEMPHVAPQPRFTCSFLVAPRPYGESW